MLEVLHLLHGEIQMLEVIYISQQVMKVIMEIMEINLEIIMVEIW
jgi:hypothetical protein